ncbi:MAG: HlyC/CorC family transporter [Rhodospirillales bacterium]|nr:HlyC/CorC family transporter [Rhodospirillales bacterium]
MITTLDWIYLGAVVVLLLMSALLSASETALTAVSRPLMHQLEQDGDVRAALVNRLLQRRERVLGALLLGNNMVNILASALMTSILIGLFGEAGVAYATAVMTVILVAFGEILPKTYAIHNADRAVRRAAPMVLGLTFLLAPFLVVVQSLVRATLRLFGVRVDGLRDIDTAMTELKGAIEIHAEADEVRHERAMLRSILELGDVTVEEIMTHRRNAFTLDADLPPEQLLDQILASPYTRVPLWRGNPDNIIGVVHAKALLRALRVHMDDVSHLDVTVLAQPPWFIPDTTALIDQLQSFRDRHEHFALVVDEYGVFLGVVTLEDILEEIVGDIKDEHDLAVGGVKRLADGSLAVAGSVTLRDLNREFDWRLPDERAATLAGLLLHEARRIPEVGQVFGFFGFRFEILRRHKNQIGLVKVTPPLDRNLPGQQI